MWSLLLLLSPLVLAVFSAGNPFDNHRTWYVNPAYQKELSTSIATATGKTKANLQKMYTIPSAYWIDVMAKISGNGDNNVEDILKQASSSNPVPLVVFIVYDLPNRDCHAKASNGEICCTYNADRTCNYNAGGDCSAGINTYKTKYIDPLVALFSQYSNVPIVAIIEPDSLPNLATNMGDPHCGNTATQKAYLEGIPYAVQKLSTLSNVDIYVDAAHGGWLGWQNNAASFVETVTELGILKSIRGFSTNVANYQPLGTQCPQTGWCLNGQHQGDTCCADPCHLEGQYNPANNELNYAAELYGLFRQQGFSPKFIIDTGRNGVSDMRSNCANWCNIRGAGVGLFPTTATGNTTLIDAYFWLKTPGESDGCTQVLPNMQNCPRFDESCASPDSIGSRAGEPRAPQAGQWFDYQVKQLADNANF